MSADAVWQSYVINLQNDTTPAVSFSGCKDTKTCRIF